MILLSLHLSLLGDQTASSILHGISAWSAVQGIILGSTMFAGLGGVGSVLAAVTCPGDSSRRSTELQGRLLGLAGGLGFSESHTHLHRAPFYTEQKEKHRWLQAHE